eukprot:5488270-Pyramimonas_sp.AAC.1
MVDKGRRVVDAAVRPRKTPKWAVEFMAASGAAADDDDDDDEGDGESAGSGDEAGQPEEQKASHDEAE